MSETKQLGRGLVTEIFGDAASVERGYRQAIRDVLEWLKTVGDGDVWSTRMLHAETIEAKLQEMRI